MTDPIDNVIPGFTDMTEQQLFDMSWRHIHTTQQKSFTAQGCTYSGPGCAAAPFLRDADVRRTMDDIRNPDGSPTTTWPALVRLEQVPRHRCEFVDELQFCHDSSLDSAPFMSDFKSRMLKLAARHNLTIPQG